MYGGGVQPAQTTLRHRPISEQPGSVANYLKEQCDILGGLSLVPSKTQTLPFITMLFLHLINMM